MVRRVNDKKIEKEKGGFPEGLRLLDRNSRAFKSGEFGDEKSLDYRPTVEGLLIGEILTEINNKNFLLKFWNNYKYSLMLDMIWLLGVFAVAKFMLPEGLWKEAERYQITVCGATLNYTCILLLAVFVIWPLTSYALRKLYLAIEASSETR